MNLFDEVRAAAARVAARAQLVRIDEAGLAALADRLEPALGDGDVDAADPAHHRLGTEEATLAFVVTLDAVNFGSGWFPVLAKPPGLSGYFTIASALRRHFEARGPWSARELAVLTANDCADVFEQEAAHADIAELMALFAKSLTDLGRFLEARCEGRFENLVARAAARAERLVRILAEMPLYADVSRYDDFDVPLYKRAQITVADLAAAFDGEGPGRFDDLDSLTMFPDNLVPHVLRCEGVLVYTPELAGRIEGAELLAPGSREEVEIRAVGLHAVERLVERLRASGRSITAAQLDQLLWSRGQSPAMKARNRHRSRTVFY